MLLRRDGNVDVAMSLVAGAVKDISRVVTGVGIVAAECAKGVRLGALAFKCCSRRDACVGGDFASSEVEWRGSQRRGVAMDGDVGESRKAGQAVPPQPEDLFVPTKAAASTEARPFKSAEADADVEPLSQQVGLPSVDAHLPPK